MIEHRVIEQLSLFSNGIMNLAGGILRYSTALLVPSRHTLNNRMRPTVPDAWLTSFRRILFRSFSTYRFDQLSRSRSLGNLGVARQIDKKDI